MCTQTHRGAGSRGATAAPPVYLTVIELPGVGPSFQTWSEASSLPQLYWMTCAACVLFPSHWQTAAPDSPTVVSPEHAAAASGGKVAEAGSWPTSGGNWERDGWASYLPFPRRCHDVSRRIGNPVR